MFSILKINFVITNKILSIKFKNGLFPINIVYSWILKELISLLT